MIRGAGLDLFHTESCADRSIGVVVIIQNCSYEDISNISLTNISISFLVQIACERYLAAESIVIKLKLPTGELVAL